MPHVHGVFWLDEEEKSNYQTDENKYDKEKVVELIDNWISCSLDTGDEELDKIIKYVNVHAHSKSCKKYKTSCRFNFPRLPSDETIIATPLSDTLSEEERKAKLMECRSILEKVKQALREIKVGEDDISLKDFLSNIGVDYDDYQAALKISEKGDVVILRRTVKERFVNNYNKCFAKSWDANTDIQFCMDLHAVITYITDYFSKEDRGLTKLLRQAINDKKGCDDFQRLNHVKKVYFTHRQKNLSEATYKLVSGLSLKHSNVHTTFVSTGFPENRSTFLRRCEDFANNEAYSSDEEMDATDSQINENEKISVQGRAGKFFKSVSVHEKYAMRPKELEDMCFGQFVSVYVSAKKPKKEKFNGNVSISEGSLKCFGSKDLLPRYIQLTDESFMRLRTAPLVLRLHSSHKKEGHEEFYAELLLFCPWRNEFEEFHPDSQEQCIKTFNEHINIINRNRKCLFPFSDSVKEMAELMSESEDTRPQHVFDTIDGAGEQADADDLKDLEPPDKSELPSEVNEGHLPEKTKYRPIDVLDEKEMLEMARKLSFEQMIPFTRFIDFCMKTLAGSGVCDIDPPRVILHGGGGVGKTSVINTIAKWAEKILRKPGDNPMKPKVILLAPTGMAASLIRGTTLQTGLNLKFGTKYVKLSDSKREEFRVMFEELQLVIIDEFSMVSADALYDIHRRLQEIFISKDFFGGRAILFVGDLLQLPPVKGRPIFSKPKSDKNASLWNSTDNLWSSFEVVTLDVNFRQGISDWTLCLNRLRKGELSEEDRHLLEKRRLEHFPDLNQENACHVYYTNMEVNAYNEKMMDSLPGDYVFLKADLIVPRGYRPFITDHGTVDDTQFRKILQLKKGVRVMLTFNVSISDSLINGALGKVLDFVYNKSTVIAIIVAFDDPSVGEQQKQNYKDVCKDFQEVNGCPIFRSTLQYQGRAAGSMNNHGAKCKVTQFPLRPAFASTTHKLQGGQIAKGSDLVAHGYVRKGKIVKVPECLYYVMLSRCSSLDNVFLDKYFQLEHIQCSKRALEAAENLEERSLNKSLNVERDIFYINIRSFWKHEEDIFQDIYAKSAKFVCLTETWIAASETSPMEWKGRLIHHASFGKGKGCCILTDKGHEKSWTVCCENFQIVSIAAQNLQLTVVYISHDAKLDDVKQAFIQILDMNAPQLIVGDFNFDTRESNCLETFFNQIGLKQIVQEVTHKEGRSLDHLYLSDEIKERVKHDVQFKYYSDHAAIQLQMQIKE